MAHIIITIDQASLDLDYDNESDVEKARDFCDALEEALRNEYPSPSVEITVEPEFGTFNGGRIHVSEDEDEWESIASGGRDGVLDVIKHWSDQIWSS